MLFSPPQKIVLPKPKSTITITGNGSTTSCYVTINGVKYDIENVLKVETGTVITFSMSDSTYYYVGHLVRVDGTVILSGAGTVDYTVNGDITINFKSHSYQSGSTLYWNAYCYADITT